MIYKKMLHIAGEDIKYGTFFQPLFDDIFDYVEQFGFQRISSQCAVHEPSGAVMYLENSSVTTEAYSRFHWRIPYAIDENGNITTDSILTVVRARESNTGSAYTQLILGISDSGNTVWFTFCNYNAFDTINPDRTFIYQNNRLIRYDTGYVHTGSSASIGTIRPWIANYHALPNKTHISDACLADGSLILEETVPSFKSYASLDIQPNRIYEINGQQYLAIPNRLLVEC